MSGSNSSVPDALHSPRESLEPLALTVHSLPAQPLASPAQRTRRGRLIMLLVLLMCAAPVVASYFMFYVVRPTGQAYATLIQPSVTLPAVVASDLSGAAVPLLSLKGQWLLVVVAQGRCDEACENRLYQQRQLREMLGRERERLDKVLLLADDTPLAPAQAQALAAGVPVRVLRVPRAVLAGWLQPEAGRALTDHLYVVDPVGEWMMRAPTTLEPARFKRDLDRLLRASAFWDQPGR